jgi:hypothetical protein
MARPTRQRQSTARKARNKVIEIAFVLAFLIVMVAIVLPWAASYLADSFAR